MAGEPSFFSLGVQDVEQGRAFYTELFGWRTHETPGGFAVTTPGVPGGVHGGDPQAAPYLFFRVEDLDEAIARVHALGGSVQDADHGDEDEVARFGRFRLCRDDQGSSFGLHQPPA
jgi:predicted enzyme related to lactoylglutathione lyase